ncbi:MAG: hypothetical protein NZ958_07135 [Bacteroidia bacterium]|nr:hypothetical protein [Bacteroidia bacterium]MDW8089472.1 hypothetical protein [Bacteroidia bacterium]
MRRLGLALLCLPLACQKKDSPRPKQPPLVRFFLDSIGLEGESRLPSRFTLRWYGDDPDGYIVGYEVRLSPQDWRFTTQQESTFVVPFTAGEQYKDVVVEVRAVDNDGLRTTPPARLRVPLRNSPPLCKLQPQLAPPDTTLPAITLSFTLEDPDGSETLDSLYLRIGNGPWFALSPRHRLLTLVPVDPTAPSPTYIFAGTSLTPIATLPTPLPLDDTVRIALRVKDQGGLFSEIETTQPIYIRRKTADWLFLDSWNNDEAYTALEADLRSSWGAYDYWNLRLNTHRPPALIPTWLHIWRLYPRIFWIGSSITIEDLEAAEVLIEKYLQQGGRLCVNFPLPARLDTTSAIFRWSPMDSLSRQEQDGLLPPNSPVQAQVSGFPNLTNGLPFFLSGINPPYPKGTAQVLYEMPGLIRGNGQPWPSGLPRTAAIGFPTASGKFLQIYLILPLHQLGGPRTDFLTALQNAFLP